MSALLLSARDGDHRAFAALIEPHRRELRAHCYRFSGSMQDADELVQEALLRAWRGLAGFQGRSSLRTWLYRVATNVCLEAAERRKSRTLPQDLGPPVSPSEIRPPSGDIAWLEPCPDGLYLASQRESVQLAFLVALQALPPRQRAVLILRDVVGLEATECAEQLEMSVVAVNSALQRARETIEARRPAPKADIAPPALLQRYMDAWHRADPNALVALLREDATLAMPPMSTWLQGPRDIVASLAAMVLTPDMVGRYTLVPIEANGAPAFAAYADGRPAAIHVLDIQDGQIRGILAFVDPRVFDGMGLSGAR